jgi:hypothetical protein
VSVPGEINDNNEYKFCFNYYDLDIRNESLTGCLDAIVNGSKLSETIKIGCFRSAPNSKFFEQNIVSFHQANNVTYFNEFNSDAYQNLAFHLASSVKENNFSLNSLIDTLFKKK